MKNKAMLIIGTVAVLFVTSFFAYAEGPIQDVGSPVMPETRGSSSDIMINVEEEVISQYQVALIEILLIRDKDDGSIVDISCLEHELNSDGSIENTKSINLEELNLNEDE